MRVNRLAEMLREGRAVLGVANMYPAAGIIEGMCTGWDFVWIDGQHGEFSYDSVLHAVHVATAVGIESLLRTPGQEPGVLGLYADTAPSAIMVPMVNSVAEARAVVKALRFAPLGCRSYGGRRVIDLDGRNYYNERELLVVAQIETVEAVKASAGIIGTPGIDALFIGLDDMRVQLGLPINVPAAENSQLMEFMQRVADAAKKAGKVAGCVVGTADALRMSVRMGYQLLVGGGDIGFLRNGSATQLQQLRPALAVPKKKEGNRPRDKKRANLAGRQTY